MWPQPILAPGAICGGAGAGHADGDHAAPDGTGAAGEMGRKMDAFKERVIRNSLGPLPFLESDARKNTAAGCLTVRQTGCGYPG